MSSNEISIPSYRTSDSVAGAGAKNATSDLFFFIVLRTSIFLILLVIVRVGSNRPSRRFPKGSPKEAGLDVKNGKGYTNGNLPQRGTSGKWNKIFFIWYLLEWIPNRKKFFWKKYICCFAPLPSQKKL